MSVRRTPLSLRFAAVLVGLIAALAPAALLAYDAGTSGTTAPIVAQATETATPDATETATETATATATGTASPAPPATGGAGLVNESGSIAAAAVLVVLAASVVAGGRVLSTRRSS